MKYSLIIFEDEEFWIELDDDGYADRQMIISNTETLISCFTDCLAEGIVNLDELEGKIKSIDYQTFQDRWDKYLKPYRTDWELKKKILTVCTKIQGRIKYFYPQGAVVELDNGQGICLAGLPENILIGTLIEWVIAGYDEENMWFILEPIE